MHNESKSYILPFSAKSKEALEHTSARVLHYLKEHYQIDLADASWTLQKGRRVFAYRKAVIASRKDMESNTFHICSGIDNIVNKRSNLVLVLPGAQDQDDLWEIKENASVLYPILQTYEEAVKEIISELPNQLAEKVRAGREKSEEVNLYRALISGYAHVKLLLELGVRPTALAGEGIAELAAFVAAGAVSIQDAIHIVQTYGKCATYEDIYRKYKIRKQEIPVMRKAGKKAKHHLEEALVIKLGREDLENSITRRCMSEVSRENVVCLIENSETSYINNLYLLLAQLWCRGIELHWEKLKGDFPCKRVVLPSYVFAKKEFDSDVLFGAGNGLLKHKISGDAPETEEEREPQEILRELWREILGLSEIKQTDDFFEKGGDSLTAIKLSAKIKEKLKVEFPIAEIFHHAAFGKMEKYIHSHMKQKSEDSIEKLGEQDYYEASSAQKRMYAVNELIEDGIPYNFAAVYQVKGKLDKEKIQNCFTKMVQRHEAFRTRFELVDGDVVQIIEEKVDFQVQFENREKEELEEAIQEKMKPFDLRTAPLLRTAFISLNEEEHVMVLDMHHIISDQSSLDVLLKEIGQIYQGKELPELEIQYKDFAKWQNDFFRSGKMREQLEHWKKEFEGGVPVLDLYTDYERPETMSLDGRKVHFVFPEHLNEQILHFTKEQGITPNMFIMTALTIMLWKYTNQNEIVLGTPISGRRHAKLENIVGMFVNTLAIKSEIDEEISILDFLHDTKEKLIQSYENQDCPFDRLVEEMGIPKNVSRNPLFDILFNYINIGTDEIEIEGLSFKPYDNGKIDVKFDLSFTVEEKNGKFELDIDYAAALYKEETISLMGNRLLQILSQMIKDVKQQVSSIEMMTADERNWLVNEVNTTATDFPADKTALRLFEQNVRDTPDAIAIEWMEERISYRQLNNMANQLADKLAERNIGYQDPIAILLERGLMQMVSMLGIMKLGAVYVPIDPQYPQDRIDYILEDSNSKLVITNDSLASKAGAGTEKFLLDEKEHRLERDEDSGIESGWTPKEFHSDDLIYIIYTSGSTGKPKGTLIMHKNVVRVVKNTNYIEISPKDRIMQISNYVFDCSVFDIYSALLNGAALVIIPRETSLEIPSLAQFIHEKQITVFCISTALFHMLVDWKAESLINVRKVIVAGEQLSLPHARKAVAAIGEGKLINAYGPTESAVFATYYPVNEVEDVSIVPIGYPLSNTEVYVVDERKQLVPLNVPGELCLGGEGIGKGYLNRDDLTAEKFISLKAAGGKRVYRTGDRVMWNSSQELVFLGRMDFQIKLRGYRVELGEVERVISSLEGIKNTVVTAEKDHLGELYMTAYYTVEDMNAPIDVEDIRHALSSKLPEYMIPTKYTLLKEFPLNFSGKVDRKALPRASDEVKKPFIKNEPKTPLEEKILGAMQKILNTKELGVKDNFFRHGGQSIKAIALVKELYDHGINIKVNEIFQYQTAEKIAASIEPPLEEDLALEEMENTLTDVLLNEKQIKNLVAFITAGLEGLSDVITAADMKRQFPLSPIQKGHHSKGSDQSGLITAINGRIPQVKIKAAIAQVIRKNQLLHCTLVETNGVQQWCEYNVDGVEAVIGNYLPYADISMYAESVKEKIIAMLSNEIMLREYTQDELLWRVCVLKESEAKHIVIWGSDHLIFDGMSAEIIKHGIEKELGKGAKEAELPVRSYQEYTEVLQQGPVNMTEAELIEGFHLEEWSQWNSKAMEWPGYNIFELQSSVELKIPLSEVKEADIWWYAFDFVSHILRDYKNIEYVPFAFLDYARSYQGKDFYNTVGEFLDIVPVISGKGDRNFVESVMERCRDHSVNFLALLGEEGLRKEYPKLNEMIGKYYFNNKEFCDFILYNFQGFISPEEKKAFEHHNQNRNLARMTITVNYDRDNLYIELEDAAGLQEKQIRKYAEKIMRQKEAVTNEK